MKSRRIVSSNRLPTDIELIRGGGGTATNGGVIPDESYCVPHNRRGVLSMANNGKDSNGSQFIVSLKPNPWMDYYYVAFGYYPHSYIHQAESDTALSSLLFLLNRWILIFTGS